MITISKKDIEELYDRIRKLYLADHIPWVVGYSGGKDSTATLQLVWYALSDLPPDERAHKSVHVISTDTLVESPVVADWVNRSLIRMKESAERQSMPLSVHRLTPSLTDTFWVNLIGRGYPAPRPKFRWCTTRLKIEPSNRFIRDMIADHGETILVLGTRKAESSRRAATMQKYEKQRVREWLSPNGSLPNSYVFSPIENWSNDDVWMYLMQYKNPWGHSNKELLTMYRGASADGECPLVLDTNTPSCGNSRFGCWVCTVVDEDKSMKAMIQNDEEKSWMMPLLEFRNEFGDLNDRDRRDFRRLTGKVQLFNGRSIHGPYTKKWREHWLRRLLTVEEQVRKYGPADFQDIRLITDEELREIRRIWVLEKHEFEDSLPRIYKEVTGNEFDYDDNLIRGVFGREEWDLLRGLCGDNELMFELQSALLDIEQRSFSLVLRRGIMTELTEQIRKCFYDSEEDAVEFSRTKSELQKARQVDIWKILLEEGNNQ